MLKTAVRELRRESGKRERGAGPSEKLDQRASGPQWLATTLGLGQLGGVLLWAAFPPVDLAWLAWIAPVCWLWLVLEPRSLGRMGYFSLWLAGTMHWLLMLEGIRLAHPALYAGWIALAAYLGVYLPVFVGLTRVAVHRMRWSLVIAAPVVWVGLELVRGHLITGFSMGLLAHTQAEFPRLIQISDVAGGYTLSFVIMLVAACLTRIAWHPRRWWPMLPAGAAIAATLLYGQWRISQTPPGSEGPTAQVALIQGSLDTVFEEMTKERFRDTFDHYRMLTEQAVKKQPNLDLVLWPESMFVFPETMIEEPLGSQNGVPPDDGRVHLEELRDSFRRMLAHEAALANANTDPNHRGTKLLIGTNSVVYGDGTTRHYNSALLADKTGNVVGRYYKAHPVMFGEYVPFAEHFTWLNRVTPIAVGLSAGEGPKVFEVAGLKMSPSICFESTIPHLIRGQLRQLASRGTPADVLVNVTNDGWFWGTGMLDLHFRCGVFRAVENRKPLLVVANTGISSVVDGNGVVRQRGPRREPEAILAEVRGDGRASPYATIGDWPSWLCVLFWVGLAAIGWRRQAS
jgi:apolipoprotein N-acyltransferase